MRERPSFLLVHGSWHGAWCWDHLRPALTKRGFDSVAVDLPSCTAALGNLTDDAAAVSSAAAAIDAPVIVVGHSYGGAVISEARYGANVVNLIYLCAFMPDTGRNYVSYLPPGELPPYVGMRDDGTFAVPPGLAIPSFYADCEPEVAKWAESQLRPQSQAVLAHDTGDASWRHVPSSYIVTEQDRALPPDFQRMFAAQAEETYQIDSSHSPFLSRPDELADLLVTIARQPASERVA
jgi:pimeloyl-ACP methyl ester carboxylesterase